MRAWRRFRGGHWEQWYIDVPVAAPVWVASDECHKGIEMAMLRPLGAFGTPVCEDWPAGGRLARFLRLARPAVAR